MVASGGTAVGLVRARIEGKFDRLSKMQQQVARYILSDPTVVLFATTTAVAQRTGVNAATVVRFAQRLGYRGYTEFRDSLRLEFPTLRTPLDRWDDEVSGLRSVDTADLVDRVRSQTLANLSKTFEQINPRSIDVALDCLLAAKRVIIVGGGSSRALAMQLHRVLQIAQMPVHVIEDWFGLLFDAPTFRATDVLLAVTTWRYAKVTIEAVRHAHEAGARAILLTDAEFAPGTTLAHVTLLFAPQAIGELASPVAGAAVIDCLAAGLVARIPDRVKQSMRLVERMSVAHELTCDQELL